MSTKIIAVIAALLFSASFSYSQSVKTISSIDEYQKMLDSTKGKIVLVNFWATWCPPCVKEFPELVKLYRNYKEKDFVLLFISLDEKTQYDSKLIPFLKNQNVDFTSYFGNFSNPESLMTYIDNSWQGEIPYTGIYDKEGKLTTTLLGNRTYEQFESELKKLLN